MSLKSIMKQFHLDNMTRKSLLNTHFRHMYPVKKYVAGVRSHPKCVYAIEKFALNR